MADFGDPVTRPFWEAARQHRLVVQTCRDCTHAQLYPRVLCTRCGGSDLELRDATGAGTVVAATEVHLPAHPELTPPYTTALIQLAEGPRVLGNPPGAVAGDRVVVRWQERDDAPPLPQWVVA